MSKFMVCIKRAIRNLKHELFLIKYRMRLAKEGIDFCSCNVYMFCDDCSKNHKPCRNHMDKRECLSYMRDANNINDAFIELSNETLQKITLGGVGA